MAWESFVRRVVSSVGVDRDGRAVVDRMPGVWTLVHRGRSGGGRLDVWAFPDRATAYAAGAELALESGLDEDPAAVALVEQGHHAEVLAHYEATQPEGFLLRVQPAFLIGSDGRFVPDDPALPADPSPDPDPAADLRDGSVARATGAPTTSDDDQRDSDQSGDGFGGGDGFGDGGQDDQGKGVVDPGQWSRVSVADPEWWRWTSLLTSGQAPPATASGGLHRALVEAFTAAGWPVEAESYPEVGWWLSYPGPVKMQILDPEVNPDVAIGDDPGEESGDDPREVADAGAGGYLPAVRAVTGGAGFELLCAAPLLEMTSELDPFGEERGGPVGEHPHLPGDVDPVAVVARVGDQLGEARAAALADAITDVSCDLCGDQYQSEALLAIDAEGALVCPACVFDGDVDPVFLPALVAEVDQARGVDLAAPAMWGAVAALVGLLARPGLRGRAARACGRRFVLMGTEWDNPAMVWCWLPPTTGRPAWLTDRGPGLALAALTHAASTAEPALFTEFARRGHEHASSVGESQRAWLIDRCWPAVLAYRTAIATQDWERRAHRAPEHVAESFDTLAEHADLLGVETHQLDLAGELLALGLELTTELFPAPPPLPHPTAAANPTAANPLAGGPSEDARAQGLADPIPLQGRRRRPRSGRDTPS